MTNRTIDLTESQIKRHIYEATLNELDWRTYGNAAAKRIAQSKEERKLAKKSLAGKKKDKEAWKQHTLLSRKRYRQAQKLGKMAQDTLNKQAEKGEKFVMSPLVADDEYPRGRYARITDNSGKKPSGKSSAVAQAHNFFSGKSEYDKDKSMWESVKRAVTENVVRALAQTETGRRLTESTDRVDKRQVIAPIIETVNRLVEGVRRMVCEAEDDLSGAERIEAIATNVLLHPTEEDAKYVENIMKGNILIMSYGLEHNSPAPLMSEYSDIKVSIHPTGHLFIFDGVDLSRQGNPRHKMYMLDDEVYAITLGKPYVRGAHVTYLVHNEQEREQAIKIIQTACEKQYKKEEEEHKKRMANADGDSLEDFDFNDIPTALADRIEYEAGQADGHESTTVECEWYFRDGSTIVASAGVTFDPEQTYYNGGDYYTPPESGGYTTITITDYGVWIEDGSRDGYEYTEDDIKALNIDWSPLDKLNEIEW